MRSRRCGAPRTEEARMDKPYFILLFFVIVVGLPVTLGIGSDIY